MNKDIILFSMIFLHIVDDFCLQGIMASMKQKSWWQKDPVGSQSKYKYDYIAALLAHSFSWAFMIMIPILVSGTWNPFVLILNMLVHAFIDNMKANHMRINLIADQSMHLLQILVTWLCFVVY